MHGKLGMEKTQVPDKLLHHQVVAGWSFLFSWEFGAFFQSWAQALTFISMWVHSDYLCSTRLGLTSSSGCHEQKSTLVRHPFEARYFFLFRAIHYLASNVRTSILSRLSPHLLHQYPQRAELPVVLWDHRGLQSIFFPQATNDFHSPRESFPSVLHWPLDISGPDTFLGRAEAWKCWPLSSNWPPRGCSEVVQSRWCFPACFPNLG